MVEDNEDVKTNIKQESGLPTPKLTPERQFKQVVSSGPPLPAIVSSLDFLHSPFTNSLVAKAADLASQKQVPSMTLALWQHITETYFLHHSNTHLRLSLVPINAGYGTSTFAVVQNTAQPDLPRTMRILLLVTCVAHGPYWDQVFDGLLLPERTFSLQLGNYMTNNFGEVDVIWILANATVAEIRSLKVCRQGPFKILDGPRRCDLAFVKERDFIGDWLQELARVASVSTED